MDHAGIGTSPGPPPHGPLSSRPAEALPGAQVGDAYLGTGHADLRPRIDVDTAVGLSGDGAAHGVGDTHSQGPAVLTVAQRQQGVCGLTCHMGPPFQPRGHRSMALSARASPPPAPTHVLSLLHSNQDPDTAGMFSERKILTGQFFQLILGFKIWLLFTRQAHSHQSLFH